MQTYIKAQVTLCRGFLKTIILLSLKNKMKSNNLNLTLFHSSFYSSESVFLQAIYISGASEHFLHISK